MVNDLILESELINIEISTPSENHRWCRCYMVSKESKIYIGANVAEYIYARFLEVMQNDNVDFSCDIGGFKTKWVISLNEAHYVIYSSPLESGKRIIVHNTAESPTNIAAVIDLSAKRKAEWIAKLERVLQK